MAHLQPRFICVIDHGAREKNQTRLGYRWYAAPPSFSRLSASSSAFIILSHGLSRFWWISFGSSAGFAQVERVEPAGAALRGRRCFSLTTPPLGSLLYHTSRASVRVDVGPLARRSITHFPHFCAIFSEIDPRIVALPKRVQRAHALDQSSRDKCRFSERERDAYQSAFRFDHVDYILLTIFKFNFLITMPKLRMISEDLVLQ